jgi:eukaryotic-like serine/threonine-protein kinase
MPLTAGTHFGPYEIRSALGAGGMGEVYEARDTRLGRTVAIKVLPPEAASDPERRRRFEQEARAASALNHPHICVLHDIGSQDGVDFLVMEHLDGQPLAHRLRKGPIPLHQVLDLGAQIADALAAAHRKGIVHRDLKPGNIMLTRAGVKLLDFGLAKLRPQAAAAGANLSALSTQGLATSPGAVMGTVPYMPPEQLEGKDTDARTDLFAFGCVLYEMLTARRAFAGETEASVISAIMTGQPPALTALQPVTPPALDRLVHRCLAKDPDDRWQHAADVAEELRGISQDSVAPTPARMARPVGLRGWRLAAVVALVVVVGAVVTWIAISRPWLRSPAPAHFALTMPGNTVFVKGGWQTLAVAADGSGVVYQGHGAGADATQLFWHDLNGLGGWALAGTEGALNPFLSPDGRWVGFFRKGKILKLPLRAGRIVEGSPVADVATTGESPRGFSWGADGSIVYGTMGGLWRVAANGGEARQVTEPDRSKGADSHRWPSFLPGGRDVLFTVLHTSGRADRSAIAVLSLETGRWKKVIEGGVYARYLPSGHLVFARDGALLALPFDAKTLKVTGKPVPVLNDVWTRPTSNHVGFDVATNGTLVYALEKAERPSNVLVWVTREGQVEPVMPERQAYVPDTLSLSPDGQRLAVVIAAAPYGNIWVYDLRDRRWQQLGVQADCDNPVWSPTGDRLAFQSNRDGIWNLYVMPADGESPPGRVTESRNLQWPFSWSPDGRLLAYEEQRQSPPGYATFVLALDGSAVPWQWMPAAAQVTVPAFSPDGRWLAYQSRESGQLEVWVRPFPGPGTKQRVSGRDGGFAPAWSSDGREIFYVERLKDTRIMGRRVVSSSPLRLADAHVAFALPFALSNPLFFQSRAFAVTPDGQRVLVVQADERAPKDINALQVIRNWPEEVKAKLAGQ